VKKIKEQQRGMTAGWKGLVTVMGKPPKASVKLYKKLKFKQELTFAEAKESVEQLVVPESNWGEDAFKAADTSNNGEIDLEELKQALAVLGMPDVTPEEAKWIFDAVDADGSGYLTYEEFREVAAKIAESHEAQSAEELMKGFDVSGDGGLDQQETWDALEALGVEMSEAQMAMFWEKCDTDHSGELSVSEFKAVVEMARVMVESEARGQPLTEEECRESLDTMPAYEKLMEEQKEDVMAVVTSSMKIKRASAADAGDGETIAVSELEQIVKEVLEVPGDGAEQQQPQAEV